MGVATGKSFFWIVVGAIALAIGGTLLFRTPSTRPYLELVNYLLAVAGFVILWVQVRSARTAAETAREATSRALSAVSERFTIADISHVRQRLGQVQDALRGERFEQALRDIQDLRAELTQLRTREGFREEEARQIQIQDMVATLARFQDKLERRLDDGAVEIPVPTFNKKLGDYILILAGWSEESTLTIQRNG